jgi:hypothetical protein
MNQLDYVFEYGRIKKENKKLRKAIIIISIISVLLFCVSIATLFNLVEVIR